MIKFKLNKQTLIIEKLDTNITLNEVRKRLGQKLPEGFLFICSDYTEIEKNDEEEFKLSDIIENENKSSVVFLSLKEENNDNEEKKEIIIENLRKSKEISSQLEERSEKNYQNKINNSNKKLNEEIP